MSRARAAPQKTPKKNLTEQEIEEIKEAFDLFDADSSGFIDPREVNQAMSLLSGDQQSTVYRLLRGVRDLGHAVSFDEFIDYVDEQLGDRSSREGIHRIFNLFADGDTVTVQDMARIARQLGESMSIEDIQHSLGRVSSNQSDMTFDDFYSIMTKRIYAQAG